MIGIKSGILGKLSLRQIKKELNYFVRDFGRQPSCPH